MNDKWMTDIKRKADSYERKAPDDMLDNIRQEMARRGLMMTPPQPVAQTRRLTWQRWAVAASLAAIVGGTAVYFAWHQADSGKQLSQQLQPRDHTSQQQRQVPSTVGRHAAESTHVSATNLLAHISGAEQGEGTMITRILPSTSITTDGKEEKDVLSQQPLSANGNTIEKKEADSQTPKQQSSANHPIDRYQDDWKNSDQLLAYDNAKSDQSIHVSAYYQGVGDFQSNGNGNGNAQVMDMSDPLVGNMPVLYAYPTLLNKVLQETPIHSEKHHHLPVRAGVSVSIPLNGQWGVTTGLTYSTMSSDFEDLYADHRENSTQRLHYLGIPVSLHYNVWQQSKVKVYASAGGEVEKLVYGKKKTHYADMVTTKTTSTTVTEHRPVLSTHVNAGISYSILPSLSVFAEPGLAYYFKNGSGVKSAYTDKQLLFNVNVGVRFGK